MKRIVQITAAAVVCLAAAAGCERSTTGLDPVKLDTNPVVFADAFEPGVGYQAFLESKTDALVIDTVEHAYGSASLRATVPGPQDLSNGTYAGGAVVAGMPRNFSGYNCLVFWAKASKLSTLDIAGFGNDNTGTSQYGVMRLDIDLSTDWEEYIIPIPLPEKLDFERGLFYFAEGYEGTSGHEIWFDEIQFATRADITNPRPSLQGKFIRTFVGAELEIEGTGVTFSVKGTDETVYNSPRYFTFASSNDTVAVVEKGVIKVIGMGTTSITAKLDTVDATGTITVSAIASPPVPPDPPTEPAADVISLFSNSYPNRSVDTWSADWDRADLTDLKIGDNDIKAYSNLLWAGIEFTHPTLNAVMAGMNYFHIDVWLYDGTAFKVKLVDFGADGVYSGPGTDDREYELLFDWHHDPPVLPGRWVGLDIPLADFVGVPGEHLAQLVLSGNANIIYIDNVYFFK